MGSSKLLPAAQVVFKYCFMAVYHQIGVRERVFLGLDGAHSGKAEVLFGELGWCCRFTAASETRVAGSRVCSRRPCTEPNFLDRGSVTGNAVAVAGAGACACAVQSTYYWTQRRLTCGCPRSWSLEKVSGGEGGGCDASREYKGYFVSSG